MPSIFDLFSSKKAPLTGASGALQNKKAEQAEAAKDHGDAKRAKRCQKTAALVERHGSLIDNAAKEKATRTH